MTEEGSVHVEQEAKEKGVEVVVDSPPVADLAEEKEAETVVDRPPVTDATETASSIGNQRKRRRAIFEDRMLSDRDYGIFDDPIRPFRDPGRGHQNKDVANLMGYMSSDLVVEEGRSYMRDFIVQKLRATNALRPQININRNRV
ncbi:uncharacterized protein KRP23_14810 [Phytophthora ramorum]|uniref:uncharacterized protein n=1 Tax=Phytophthora ramorum TaxID=164328 RepID=UPI0030A1F2B8|nr:hypothetical protein KRP23_14810 [Phytophthora ramorum]